MRPVSWAHMATSTRFRAPSFRMRLARWALTVLGVMYSSLAISLLVRPWATGTRSSSSRAVSGSIGCLGGEVCAWANAASSRTVTLGAISASPSAAAWMAWVSRAGPASLSRNPRAPALSAPWPYSSRSKVVMTTIGRGSVTAGPGRGVGAELDRQGGRLAPVGGRADHFDVGLGVEQHRQPGAHDGLVVGDEDPDAHRAAPVRGRTASPPPP